MSLAIRLKPETARSVAFGGIGVNYAAIGTEFDKPIRIFFLQNLTDATLWFSFDGVNNHVPLIANGYLLLDVTSNKSLEQGFYISRGQTIYVKQLGVATAGSVYLSVFYGDEGR